MQEEQESIHLFDSTCNLISWETLSRAGITQGLKPSGGLQHASVDPCLYTVSIRSFRCRLCTLVS